MPNWCKNNLRICGNGEKVLELLEYLKDENGNFTMNRAVPMPKELEDTESPNRASEEEKKKLIEKYGADNWYDWRRNLQMRGMGNIHLDKQYMKTEMNVLKGQAMGQMKLNHLQNRCGMKSG